MLHLEVTDNKDNRLLERMENHYSKPKGFVGRNICYAIYYDNIYYGHIVGGSATRFLPGRNEYFSISINNLNCIINNVFYNISKVDNMYPIRNFTSFVVKEFVKRCAVDWKIKYDDLVIGFETLIEKPRTGNLYEKAGWQKISETIGYSCKRVAGSGADNWTGKRVWNTEDLRPKLVMVYKLPKDIIDIVENSGYLSRCLF